MGGHTASWALAGSVTSRRSVNSWSDAPRLVGDGLAVAAGRDDLVAGRQCGLPDVDAHPAAGAGDQQEPCSYPLWIRGD